MGLKEFLMEFERANGSGGEQNDDPRSGSGVKLRLVAVIMPGFSQSSDSRS